MRLPRRVVAILGLSGLVLITALVVIWIFTAPAALVLAIPKSSSGPGYGISTLTALFVTNNAKYEIKLAQVEVQATTKGGWKTVSQKSSRIIDPMAPSYDWEGLPSGGYRIIWLEPLASKPWRVRVRYIPKRRGFYGLIENAKDAWSTRSLKGIGRGRGWFSGVREAATGEIYR